MQFLPRHQARRWQNLLTFPLDSTILATIRPAYPLHRDVGMFQDIVDMSDTCEHAISMSRMIQLRNVPDELHQVLKARAAMEGMTLSDYLIGEVRRGAERPTPREMRERLLSRTPVAPKVAPADAVRAERDSR
jgi:hypothetical protein